MTTPDRIELIARVASLFEDFTGAFDAQTLTAWVADELGSPGALEIPPPSQHGRFSSLARPLSPLLVIVSGNTPHAAAQSLLRCLVLGGKTHFKLPSDGLREFEQLVARLPSPLAALISTSRELPADWTDHFTGLVVYGSDETISWFSRQVPPSMRMLKHGTRLAIARVDGDCEAAAALAARDVSLFDQQGCLSLHNVYLSPAAGCTPSEFGGLLAEAMAAYAAASPRAELSLSEAGAISNLRETVRYRAANNPSACRLWESSGNSQWTVVFEDDPRIHPSCLNRVVYVKPWPQNLKQLGPDIRHLSACALHPWTPEAAAPLSELPVSRVCPLGSCQNPPTTWHHDGIPALASLVRWIDLA